MKGCLTTLVALFILATCVASIQKDEPRVRSTKPDKPDKPYVATTRPGAVACVSETAIDRFHDGLPVGLGACQRVDAGLRAVGIGLGSIFGAGEGGLKVRVALYDDGGPFDVWIAKRDLRDSE